MLPPREITVSQWADENRVLTGGAAAERGQWRTRPYQREPMDVLSPSHPCRQVVVLSGAQILKTEVLLNFIGFIADVDPGPVLVVEPRTEDAKALSKDRVAPMFRAHAGTPWEDRARQVARFEQHDAAQGSRQWRRADHADRGDLALGAGHAADPLCAAG